MRNETGPAPIYEGEDGVIAWLLDGKDAHYGVPLPEAGDLNVLFGKFHERAFG